MTAIVYPAPVVDCQTSPTCGVRRSAGRASVERWADAYRSGKKKSLILHNSVCVCVCGVCVCVCVVCVCVCQ